MSLENVIVKENDSIVIGTIKVKNISYHKEVIVRTSWDNWKSQEDTFCTFSPVINLEFFFVLFLINIFQNKKWYLSILLISY